MGMAAGVEAQAVLGTAMVPWCGHGSRIHNAGASIGASGSEFLSPSSRPGLLTADRFRPSRPAYGCGALRIEMAISRKKKEETVEKVKQQLEDCYLVAGVKYKGLTVKQMQDLRRSLPETTKLLVAKNTLVEKAIEGTKWEALKPCLKGMNAWLFVHTEEIPSALKPYRSFQKQLKLEDNDFTGAVFEGKYYAPEEFKQLETMPTRAELYAKLLGVFKAPASNVVGVLQAPARKLLLTLKAYVQKLEEESAPKA